MSNRAKRDAKSLIDGLFDAGMFKEHITRDLMNSAEQLAETMFTQSQESYEKCKELQESIKHLEDSKKEREELEMTLTRITVIIEDSGEEKILRVINEDNSFFHMSSGSVIMVKRDGDIEPLNFEPNLA